MYASTRELDFATQVMDLRSQTLTKKVQATRKQRQQKETNIIA